MAKRCALLFSGGFACDSGLQCYALRNRSLGNVVTQTPKQVCQLTLIAFIAKSQKPLHQPDKKHALCSYTVTYQFPPEGSETSREACGNEFCSA